VCIKDTPNTFRKSVRQEHIKNLEERERDKIRWRYRGTGDTKIGDDKEMQ
jgi:hypothetical protein